MLMIDPPPPVRINGAAACMPRNAPVRLTASSAFHRSSEVSAMAVRLMMPALLTRMSSRPCQP
jgi:hypothetical protein